uniref:Uncharacterized protein n=1 Tax=Oryza barthii TaxID=65489 RepID=A0A0D3GFI5_9ORYZ
MVEWGEEAAKQQRYCHLLCGLGRHPGVRCAPLSLQVAFLVIKHFVGEALLVLGTDHLAYECAIGINLECSSPLEETIYVLPTAAYFEFIPFDMDAGRHAATAEPVDITALRGQQNVRADRRHVPWAVPVPNQ